jgi:hypothetical protein
MNPIHALNRARRTATAIALVLCGLGSIAILGPFAGVASAATSPTITVTSSVISGEDVAISGSGFTPGGRVSAQLKEGTTVLASSTVTAFTGYIGWMYVGYAGQVKASLPTPYVNCGGTVYGTVVVTDLSTGSAVSDPVSWWGMC